MATPPPRPPVTIAIVAAAVLETIEHIRPGAIAQANASAAKAKPADPRHARS